ncbi:MAG: hypothetical protein K5979_03810 [Ruminococcus sp.]|nr:hypothetical protein [Ruminococcus sp.]
MAERKYELMEQTAKKSSQSFKRLVFYGLIFLVYLLFTGIWAIHLIDIDDYNFVATPEFESRLDSLLYLTPFIIMFNGQFAAYFIGKKHFEKWERVDFIVIAFVAFMGYLFGCSLLCGGIPFGGIYVAFIYFENFFDAFNNTFRLY